MGKYLLLVITALSLILFGCGEIEHDNGKDFSEDTAMLIDSIGESQPSPGTSDQLTEEIIPESSQTDSIDIFPKSDTQAPSESTSEIIDETKSPETDTEKITETTFHKIETEEPQETQPIDDPEEDDDYLDIPNRGGSSSKEIQISAKGSETVLSISFPIGWELIKGKDGGIQILFGEEIGSLLAGETPPSDDWKTVATETSEINNLIITERIEKFGTKETLNFRYRYTYNYDDKGEPRSLTLILNYKALYSSNREKLLKNVEVSTLTSDPALGELSHLQNKPILILGNSFIRTSSIGKILYEMVKSNGKSNFVNAISTGYAKIGTYLENFDIINQIKNGEYGGVFICGLYSNDEIANLGKLKEICDSSGTCLVIFPAHNENRSVINSASNHFADLTLLDWKSEIDMQIESGVNKWDLCKNDSHNHSTPLAGYIGAHMIYRAIYGSVPKEDIKDSIEQSYVYSKLGDYIYSGYLQKKDPKNIMYID